MIFLYLLQLVFCWINHSHIAVWSVDYYRFR